MSYNNQNCKCAKQRKDNKGHKRQRPSLNIFFVFLNERDTFPKRTSGKLISLCPFLCYIGISISHEVEIVNCPY